MWLVVAVALHALAGDVQVSSTAELRAALSVVRPGDRILLAGGRYDGFSASNIAGTAEKPVSIASADPQAPAVFTSGVQLSDVTQVVLADIRIEGAAANGLNIDDDGSFDSPSEHVVLRRIVVRDCGGAGNHDGIKLSGLREFRLEGCAIERWGRGGSAVDMVGCHGGVLVDCVIRDRDDAPAANGVQAKGGSRDIRIERCRFEHAGQRAVNIGGSTGLAYFRPRPEGFEARDIRVEGCTFIGSLAPLAFVGVDGALVRFNTFHRPRKWFARILQETRAEGFAPCRNGVLSDNLIVYRASEMAVAVNVGDATAPQTFTFERNWWYCEDQPTRERPALPVEERASAGGRDPKFVDAAALDLRLERDSPARACGADAWQRR